MNLKFQVESLVSAVAEKDAELTARMKANASLIHEKNAIDKQLKQILRQLDLAHRTIMEQVKSYTVFSNSSPFHSIISYEVMKPMCNYCT